MGNPLVLADDLSGAAETAAALGVELHADLYLWPEAPAPRDLPPDRPVVIDLDSRHLSPTVAAERLRAALAASPTPAPLFKKIDSLLRGNVAGEVSALVGSALVVLTPALPEQGRTVVDGVLLDNGLPLAQTRLWALESTPAPASVAAALPGLPITTIGLDVVRSAGLDRRLAEAAGTIAVCDAQDSADLTAIVGAGLRADANVRFVGSSALARALGPHLTSAPSAGPDHPTVPPLGGVLPHGGVLPQAGVLYVLGTGSEAAVAQAEILGAHTDTFRVPLGPRAIADLDAGTAGELGRRLAAQLRDRSVVVQVNGLADPMVTGEAIVAGLARLVAATLATAADWPVRLMLTGGQTARAVLDELGCRRLSLLREIHPGAVLLTTETGWLVATRPGSHGQPDSLQAIHQALSTDPYPTPHRAPTSGDPQ